MYRERPSRLDGAVVWSHSGAPAAEARVLPDGCMDLLLWDGALVVAGPDTRAHLFSRQAGARITGLRFPPGMAPLVLGVPAHELRDARVPLDAVWPEHSVRLLSERIAAVAEPGVALESVAAGRLRDGPARPGGRAPFALPAASTAAELLARGRTVAEVARTLALSERQLHRHCRDAFGYGPKTLARVLRMQRALRLARQDTPLAQVAAEAGYADQAHLSREVRALAGVPVTKLLPGAAARTGRTAKAGTGTAGTGTGGGGTAAGRGGGRQGSRAKRSTELPSGSSTTAYR